MRILLALTFFVVAVSTVAAEDHRYLPLKEGSVWTYRYRNTMTAGPKIKAFNSKTEGQIIGTVEKLETRAGKEFRMVRWHYKDIPFMSEDTFTYYRMDPKGVMAGSEIEGKWAELLDIAANPVVGEKWEYDDGAPSLRSISKQGSYKTPAGEFADCVTLIRTFKKPETQKTYTAESVYCAGVGEVFWYFKQDLNGSISETTKELLSYTPAK